MMLRVSNEILERFVLDRIQGQGQGLGQEQGHEMYQPLSQANLDGSVVTNEGAMELDGDGPPSALLRGISQISVSDDGFELESGSLTPVLLRGVSQISIGHEETEVTSGDTYEADAFEITVQPSVFSIPSSPPLSVNDTLSSSRNGSPIRAVSAPMSDYGDEAFEEMSGSFEDSRADVTAPVTVPVVVPATVPVVVPVIVPVVDAVEVSTMVTTPVPVPVAVSDDVVVNVHKEEKAVALESRQESVPLPSELPHASPTVLPDPSSLSPHPFLPLFSTTKLMTHLPSFSPVYSLTILSNDPFLPSLCI